MSDPSYHEQRERQCRDLAEQSQDPAVRRLHEELAEMHSARKADPSQPQI